MMNFEDLVIFELANSHQGSVEHGIRIIKEMGKIVRTYNIKAAVKLQYRNLDTFIHPEYKGREDVNHISRFENTKLTFEEFSLLIDEIRKEGMIAMSTPFDEDGVDWCKDQGLDIIKIASCSSMDWPLMEAAVATKRPLIVSTGGKTISDIDKIYNFLTHRNSEFAFMHCIAEYPAPQEHLQLDFIDKMKLRYRDVVVGYSGHENPENVIIPAMAVAKGARILERHVGLPTETIKLNKYSMDIEQTIKWVKTIVAAKNICFLKKDGEKYISQDEIDSLTSLARGVFVSRDIKRGESLQKTDVFFAMPCKEGQLTSGEFREGMTATVDYIENAAVYEKRVITEISLARSVVHDVKGLLFEAGIAVGNDFEVELSHHYGMKHFRAIGATIISVINREYCKKLIVVLSGQEHPNHFHKVKEETFQVLYGDLTCSVDGELYHMKAGDIQTVLRNQMHSFSSANGAVFEEISTTHIKGDSYYEDSKIMRADLMERKTVIKDW